LSGRDDPRAGQQGELHGVAAEIPGAAEDSHSLARSHASVVKQHLLSGATDDDRNRGGFDVGEPGWLDRDHPRFRDGVFRISPGKARIADAEDLFPWLKTATSRPTCSIEPERSAPSVRGNG
jgi:hypothetical protein